MTPIHPFKHHKKPTHSPATNQTPTYSLKPQYNNYLLPQTPINSSTTKHPLTHQNSKHPSVTLNTTKTPTYSPKNQTPTCDFEHHQNTHSLPQPPIEHPFTL